MTTAKTPRKHAAAIKAWADGAQIQWRPGYGVPWSDDDDPRWFAYCEYRAKPSTVRYRLALFQGYAVTTRDAVVAGRWERDSTFVRWLSDWQDVEV